ncbi:MAG: serine hydrolase [Myxococcota bacterium]
MRLGLALGDRAVILLSLTAGILLSCANPESVSDLRAEVPSLPTPPEDPEALETILEAAPDPPVDAIGEPGPRFLAADASTVRAQAADRRRLAALRSLVELPVRTHLLIGRVVNGTGQPAVEYYSLGDTGFQHSHGRFWPASTVKLMAVVAALETLAEHGLSGDAELSTVDDDGRCEESVARLYHRTLAISTNDTYNRMMRIAGLDEAAARFERWGLKDTALQRLYTRPFEGASLRTPSRIFLREGDRELTLERPEGTFRDPRCPDDGNCTTLGDLVEVMRKVTLHHRLPVDDRFDLGDRDIARIHRAMRDSRNRVELGMEALFSGEVDVLNKTGTVRGDDRLDHGLVRFGRQRYLYAVSVPWFVPNETVDEIVSQAVAVVRRSRRRPPPVQRDRGAVELAVEERTLRVEPATDVQYWVDAEPVDDPPALEEGRLYTVAVGGDAPAHRAFFYRPPVTHDPGTEEPDPEAPAR